MIGRCRTVLSFMSWICVLSTLITIAYCLKLKEKQQKKCQHEYIPNRNKNGFVCCKCGLEINL